MNVRDIDEISPVANDNSETLSSNNSTANLTILDNDSDNIDSPSSLEIYSIGGTLFEDLDDSEHVVYDSSNEYKQISGSSGTLYVKKDGTVVYVKSSGASLRSSAITNFQQQSNVKLFSTALLASGSSIGQGTNGSQAIQASTLDSFDYVAKDSPVIHLIQHKSDLIKQESRALLPILKFFSKTVLSN